MGADVEYIRVGGSRPRKYGNFYKAVMQAVKIYLTFDGYPCNSQCPLVRIDGYYGFVVVNTYLKSMGKF